MVAREGVFSPAVVLAALYLRGAPRSAHVDRRRWPEVVRILRETSAGLGDAATVLWNAGLPDVGIALQEPRLMRAAEDWIFEGVCVSAVCEGYPRGWLRSLGVAAPPALWSLGRVRSSRCAAVVGSRRIPPEVSDFAASAALAASADGFTLISGGAEGCDLAAEEAVSAACGETVRVVPWGISRCEPRPHVQILSMCAPWEEFSTSNAMERNLLIYAGADRALIVQSSFKSGGTWHGAKEALRRKICPLFVRHDPASPGNAALCALGAVPIENPGDFASLAVLEVPRTSLFEVA